MTRGKKSEISHQIVFFLMTFAGGFMGVETANTAMTDKSDRWLPGGRGRIDETMKARRREEMAAFAREVEDDEAAFISCS